jgi:hypothetical protein
MLACVCVHMCVCVCVERVCILPDMATYPCPQPTTLPTSAHPPQPLVSPPSIRAQRRSTAMHWRVCKLDSQSISTTAKRGWWMWHAACRDGGRVNRLCEPTLPDV